MFRPEEMADGRRYGIRDVGSPGRASSRNEPGDHRLDLFLLGATVSGHRLLDRRRTVLEDPQTRNPEDRENHPTGVGKLKGRSRAHAVERRLNRGFRGCMLLNDGRDPDVQPREPIRHRHALGKPYLSAGDQLRRVDRPSDDGPPRASGSRVDPQDLPGLRQDASSETASSSKDRLA